MKLTRTLTAAAITASLMLPLVACSGTQTEAPKETTAQEKTDDGATKTTESEASTNEENVLFAKTEWPENDATALIPKPEFSVPLESADTSESKFRTRVTGTWVGATQQEVADYVQKLKDAGFTVYANENSMETQYSYSASNAEPGVKPCGDVDVHYYIIRDTSGGTSEPRLSIGVSISK